VQNYCTLLHQALKKQLLNYALQCSKPPTDGDGLEIHQVGDLLVVLHVALFALVEAHADQVRVHELGAHAPQDLVVPILHQGQLARVKDHAHLATIRSRQNLGLRL